MPGFVGRRRAAMMVVAAVAVFAGASACTSHQPGASSGSRGVSSVTTSPPLTWAAARAAPPPGTNLVSAGRWIEASLPLPSDGAVASHAYLFNIRCPARGTCVAVGYYDDRSGDTKALIETLSGGAWTAATAPLPAGAATKQDATSLTSIANYMGHNDTYWPLVETGVAKHG